VQVQDSARGTQIKSFVIEAPRIAPKHQARQLVILRLREQGERIPLTMESSNAKRGTISIVVQAHIEPSVTPGWRCFLLEFCQHTAPADRASATSGEAGAECRSNADGRWGDESTNTCDKLLSWTGGAETIGPILMGMSKPAHVLQRGREVQEIVNIAAVAVVDAQETEAALHSGVEGGQDGKECGQAARKRRNFLCEKMPARPSEAPGGLYT